MNSLTVITNIIRYELKYHFKSGIFWFVTAALLIFVYIEIIPYLVYYPIETEADVAVLKKTGAYSDFMVSKSEQDIRIEIKKFITDILRIEGLSSENKRLMENILPVIDNKSIAEIEEYFANSEYFVYFQTIITAKRDATIEEAQKMIAQALLKEPFSLYFARRYADRISVFLNFGVLFIFAFIFMRDNKDNIKEIIYAKPVKSREYVLGKYFGALIPVVIILTIITIAIVFFLNFKYLGMGMEFNFIDILRYGFLWSLISIFYSSALIVVLSIILRNGLAVIPVYVVYFIIMIRPEYTNGSVGYPVDFFHFIIRISGGFFDPENTETLATIGYNRLLYTALFAALLMVAVILWGKSRNLNQRRKIKGNGPKRIFKSDKI